MNSVFAVKHLDTVACNSIRKITPYKVRFETGHPLLLRQSCLEQNSKYSVSEVFVDDEKVKLFCMTNLFFIYLDV